MSRFPLIGASYTARSVIAACQRCINLFPERNPKDSPVPLTHYQRPGLAPLVNDPANLAPVRGIYQASNGFGYCVIGQVVYSISPAWVLTKLGVLLTPLTTIVSFIDNGTQILLVDNSLFGYVITLANNAFTQVNDPTGTFAGATRVDYIDTFVLWNLPGTRQFGSTLSNSITFDPTQTASKTDYPDPLQTLIVNRHEILLLGRLKSEIWFDAGNAQFPFAELPGAYIEHGIVAVYSVASSDISVFWLSQDLQGDGMVLRQRGYDTRRISNHALEVVIRRMKKTGTISDAIGYTYQQDGHVFYVLAFPSGDQTWVFDDSIGDPETSWHQRCWTDSNGVLHRDRSNCCASLYGKIVVGDWQNGTIYSLDLDTYTDTLVPGGVPGPVSYIRTFPHLMTGTDPTGKIMEADGHMIKHNSFVADLECGLGALEADGEPAQITLYFSDDRGRTFVKDRLQSTGAPGEYKTQPLWRGTGSARDRVYELRHSINGPAALNGAWVDGTVLGN